MQYSHCFAMDGCQSRDMTHALHNKSQTPKRLFLFCFVHQHGSDDVRRKTTYMKVSLPLGIGKVLKTSL